jgi:hypothetical protein
VDIGSRRQASLVTKGAANASGMAQKTPRPSRRNAGGLLRCSLTRSSLSRSLKGCQGNRSNSEADSRGWPTAGLESAGCSQTTVTWTTAATRPVDSVTVVSLDYDLGYGPSHEARATITPAPWSGSILAAIGESWLDFDETRRKETCL